MKEKKEELGLQDVPMMIVNLFSGSYEPKLEQLNLTPNPTDGRFYGYCPWGDSIDINRLGAKTCDKEVSGVIVVYTQKTKVPYEYEVIAFCENATIHREGILNESLKRTIKNEQNEEVHCSYSIESDLLVDLRDEEHKYKIIATGNRLRGQRIYNEKKNSDIFRGVQSYIDSIYNEIEIYYENLSQGAIYGDNETLGGHMSCFDKLNNCLKAHGLLSFTRNLTNARNALKNANYTCEVDPTHTTFTHKKGYQYMEAHHLVPCYAEKNLNFMKKYGSWTIDQVCNITSICPNCHRQIHSGNDASKKSVLNVLYNKHSKGLLASGLNISIGDLYILYGM